MPDLIPVGITRGDDGIEIQWNDGSSKFLRASDLRKACPCATCREKHASPIAESSPAARGSDNHNAASVLKPLALPVISKAEARPIGVERMRPVGNYAYNIAFTDGHDSGIYTFDLLYGL